MGKTKLKILVVDRTIKASEHVVRDIFTFYCAKGFDIAIFPYREDKPVTEIVVLNVNLKDPSEWCDLLSVNSDSGGLDTFYDFDLAGVETDVVYDILDGEFELTTDNLTSIEKRGVL